MLHNHDSGPIVGLTRGLMVNIENIREVFKNSSPQGLQCYSLWYYCSNILGYCKFWIVKIVTPGPIMSSLEGWKVYHRNIEWKCLKIAFSQKLQCYVLIFFYVWSSSYLHIKVSVTFPHFLKSFIVQFNTLGPRIRFDSC